MGLEQKRRVASEIWVEMSVDFQMARRLSWRERAATRIAKRPKPTHITESEAS